MSLRSYYKEATNETPKVVLDKDKGVFEIAGKSLPEDVAEFYDPIINWMEQYLQEPNKTTEFVFKMEYFNTASSKMLLDILLLLEEIQQTDAKVNVYWYYRQNDIDMAEAGKEYSDIIELPFELKPF